MDNKIYEVRLTTNNKGILTSLLGSNDILHVQAEDIASAIQKANEYLNDKDGITEIVSVAKSDKIFLA